VSRIYIHDYDRDFGYFDTATGASVRIGRLPVQLTDIAFAPDDTLYGVSFNSLYQVNARDASATYVGALSRSDANGFVIYSNGIALVSTTSSRVLGIDLETGATKQLYATRTGETSAGDLEAHRGTLLLAATDQYLYAEATSDHQQPARVYHGLPSLYGLASVNNQTLYGFSGSKAFTIDPYTGNSTEVADLRSSGFEAIWGASTASANISPQLNPVTWSLSSPQIIEEGDRGSQAITFTLSRSSGSFADKVYVSTTLEGGTNNSDYAPLLDRAFTFAAGQVSKPVRITIYGDKVDEPDEKFGLIAQATKSPDVSDYVAKTTFTIRNDDVPIAGNRFSEAAQLSIDAYEDTPPDKEESRHWRPVTAEELDLVNLPSGASYNNGVYSASVPGTSFETNAHVYIGNLENKKTLAIAFRGTDENGEVVGQVGKWDNYMNAMAPLLNSFTKAASGNISGFPKIDKILVTGHSLGGILAEYFYTDYIMKSSALAARTSVVTFGSPGSEKQASGKIVNFVHTDDIVESAFTEFLIRYIGYGRDLDTLKVSREGLDIFVERPYSDIDSTDEHDKFQYRDTVDELLTRISHGG
jgi:hypothetical protein